MMRDHWLRTPDANGAEPWPSIDWDLGDQYNIAEVALRRAETAPDASALTHHPIDDPTTTLTYGEIANAVDAVTGLLAAEDVEPGDRVGVCLPQCPELLIAQLAVFQRGAVAVPLSMLLGGDSLSHSITHSGASLVLTDAARAEAVASAADVPTVSVDPGNYASSPLGGLAGVVDEDGVHLPEAGSAVPTAPDDAALILYTSGTTGKPKGVVQGHQYLAGSLPGYQAWFELFDPATAQAARVWTPAEWAWAGALFDVVYPTLAMGGTLVSRERRSGFDAEAALRLIADEAITHTFMPATALQRIRKEADPTAYDLGSIAVVMSGGESLPESLLSWAESSLAPAIHETYGQTEANALVGNCSAAYPVQPGSMGKTYPGHDVVVVDEAGEVVPDGDVGEIGVRLPDPVVFAGYWRDDRATNETLDGDLFRTGDLAVRDADGYFWHRGRKDDLIVTAGYRVSPLEVEAVLQSQPSVAAAIVGGVPDEDRGERVTAYVVPADGATIDAATIATLRDAVRAELGAYKVPRDIEAIETIPETRSGKADRSALFGEEG